jgi:hypothetical protein
MRAILGGLAVLLLAGSLGPWGANGLTISSQFARLTAFMQTNGLLQEGHVVPLASTVAPEVRQDGYSMVESLREAGGLKRLRPWFQGVDKDPFAEGAEGWNLASNISERLGFTAYAPPPNFVNFTATVAASRDIPPASRLIGPIQVFPYAPGPAAAGATAEIKYGALTVKAEGKSWVLPLSHFLAQAKAGVVTPGQPQPPVIISMAPDMMLVVDSMGGEMGERPQLHNARLWIILQR